MGRKGWIALHRSMQDNALWNEKPFSKGQAWIDMLLTANHSQNDIMLGNEIVTLERGQFHTSELKLAERWGWSRNKVRAYLTLLEKQKMSTAKGTTKGTTITIENYGLYQDFEPAEQPTEPPLKGQRKDIEKTSKGTQTTMYNNEEPFNNDKQINILTPNNTSNEKENAPNKTNNPDNSDPNQIEKEFIAVWKEYPGHKNKSAVSKKAKERIQKIGSEHALRALRRYMHYVENERKTFPTMKYQNGSTFFNTSITDYLDDNYEEQQQSNPQPRSMSERLAEMKERGDI